MPLDFPWLYQVSSVSSSLPTMLQYFKARQKLTPCIWQNRSPRRTLMPKFLFIPLQMRSASFQCFHLGIIAALVRQGKAVVVLHG